MKKKKHISTTVQPKSRPKIKAKARAKAAVPSTPSDLEYLNLFDTCVITAEKVAQVDKVIDEKVLANRVRYEQIARLVQGPTVNFGLPGIAPAASAPVFQPLRYARSFVGAEDIQAPDLSFQPFRLPGLSGLGNSAKRSNPFALGFSNAPPDFLSLTSGRIPWFFIACVHYLECSFNFNKHLHNGDPLTGYTVQVPSGRPKVGHPPPFTFEESAVDALRFMNFDKVRQWILPLILRKLEAYNGFGYFKYKKINTPYLWSFSNHYTKGKYVKDGKYDPEAVSQQMGAAVVLKRMEERGLIYIPRF
ncbi:hypothetical protein ACFOTA_16490 [Chitinophaga sp. GCM10012297]|uniref:Lysozyme family protein n=1 Tax=Chitinophaga chungangae TaxID=2821488 RepID=A0ABS3YHA1_9BACT|nr:hypothetical protein [Chitinophaga chungangae]MBO9153820.1 hypothetical protein [Chitinophaga chungangae]